MREKDDGLWKGEKLGARATVSVSPLLFIDKNGSAPL